MNFEPNDFAVCNRTIPGKGNTFLRIRFASPSKNLSVSPLVLDVH